MTQYNLKKIFPRIFSAIITAALVLFTSACDQNITDEKITEDEITEETIIYEVKNSFVASNYDITYDDMFTTMFKTVEYDYYTLDEMKELVDCPEDSELYASVEVSCRDYEGKDFVFAWNIVFDEDAPNGFYIYKKCIYDCQTEKSYVGQEMDDALLDLISQKLVVDNIVGVGEFFGSFVPNIN